MATTEIGAARYRVTGRDEDDDKHSTHHRQGRKNRRAQDIGLARQSEGNTRSTERTKCRGQVDRGAQDVKTRTRQELHRVSARTTPSIATHKDCHDTERR